MSAEALVRAAQTAYREGLFSGTSGNLSLRVGADEMLITPTSVRYEALRAEDIVRLRLDGTVLSGGVPSSEWRMHAEVYRRCPDIRAQVHTHSPCATAYACARRPIPACLIEMLAFLGGDVPCAPYASPGTLALGQVCAEALAGRGGCLLANHGVLAVGESLAQALLRAEYIEDAAKISLLSLPLGGPVPLSAL